MKKAADLISAAFFIGYLGIFQSDYLLNLRYDLSVLITSLEMEMLKTILGLIVIILAAGGWFYLDYLNKQEQAASVELRQTVEKNRAIVLAAEQARVAAKAALEAKRKMELNTCLDAAQQANTDYLATNQKSVARKAGQSALTQAAIDVAIKTLTDAKTSCQQQFAAGI